MKISASFAVLLPLAASAVQAFKTCNVDTTELSAFGEYGVQKATLGFTLAVDSETKTYDPNVPMTVTVSGTGTFTDILLYAAASPFHQNHTGTWVDYDGDVYQTLDGDDESSIPAGCKKYGQAATLASKKSEAKSLPATFKWKPPKTPSGSLNFYAVVGQGNKEGFKVLSLDDKDEVSAVIPWPEVNENAGYTVARSLVGIVLPAVFALYMIQ